MSFCPSVRLSVCLSVTRRYYVETATYSSSGSHTTLVFPHQTLWQYYVENGPNAGVECRGIKISRFSTNISFNVGNDTKQGHRYYRMRLERHTQGFEWYHFQWPRTTPNHISRSRHYLTLNILETVRVTKWNLQWHEASRGLSVSIQHDLTQQKIIKKCDPTQPALSQPNLARV